MASITGGLGWLHDKADHLAQQNPGKAVTLFDALKAYNGRTDLDPNGLPHSVNYANSILSRVGPGYGRR